MTARHALAWVAGVAAGFAACGGGHGSGAPDAPALPALAVSALELAQTHVLPPAGKAWSVTGGSNPVNEALHFVGGRAALALVALSAPDAANPQLEGWIGDTRLGAVPLAAPSALPATEANGPAYATDRYSATVPAEWLRPGLQLRATADNYAPSAASTPVAVGGAYAMTVRVLPFYLFGADEGVGGAPALAQSAAPDATTQAEIRAKWPVTTLDAANHPAHKAVWATLVIPPRADTAGTAQPAYVAHNSGEYKDGYAAMSAVLGVLHGMLAANGESPLAVQYYAPILALDASGTYHGPGGGLGGGSAGTGDFSYSGIFIHEQGHAFGLPHAGEAYDAHAYPYNWGSLDGSAWGYDPDHAQLLAPFVPSSASTYSHCATDTFAGHARAKDAQGRCLKQDPMQSGAGDQAAGFKFATFSDFNTAIMQRWLEGRTTADATTGAHTYDGGKLVRDATVTGGYERWDGLDHVWVPVTPKTKDNGIFGLNMGLPTQLGVPVASIAVTVSNAATAGATQIYPPITYTGNLVPTIDPTSSADRAAIVPDTGTYPWYCRNGGCDYTVRVTYAGGAQRHVLLQGGFRPFNMATGTPAASTTTATSGDSFRLFVVNVPADAAITKVELLATPMVWTGMPASPVVLATR